MKPIVRESGQEVVGIGFCVRPHHHSTLQVVLQKSVSCYVLCTHQHIRKE